MNRIVAHSFDASAPHSSGDDFKLRDGDASHDPWRLSSIGSEFTVQLGKMLDSAKNTGRLKPYVGNRAVQWGRIDLEGISMVPLSPSELERFRLRYGDLLVCEGGEIGRAAIWREPVSECYYQKAIHRLRPRGNYDVRLMMYLLQLWASSGHLANYVTQTSIAHLPKEKLELIPLPVPPLPEQHAIAEVLSDVDALIEALDRLIAKKRAIKQAAMQQLLTGRTRLPGFTGEWETKRLDEIAEVDPENLSSGTDPSYEFNYISLERVDSGRLAGYSQEAFKSAPSRARRIVRQNDVLVSTVRPNLISHLLVNWPIEDVVCSTGFAVVRARRGRAHPGYLYAHFFGDSVNQQIASLLAGSNYPAISSRDVLMLRIPCPASVEEQQAIAGVLSDMDAEIEALERRRDKTQDIKQGMMQQLLAGRVRLVEPDALKSQEVSG